MAFLWHFLIFLASSQLMMKVFVTFNLCGDNPLSFADCHPSLHQVFSPLSVVCTVAKVSLWLTVFKGGLRKYQSEP